MSFCNTENILDDTISQIQDQTATMRAKLLTWLNMVMQDVAGAKIKKPWLFLQETLEDQAFSSNAIAKPSDFKKVISVKDGTDWILSDGNRLTEQQIFEATDDSATNPTPIGFDITSTEIVFYPGATGTCDLKYLKEVPTYTDVDTDTVFPLHMKNVLMEGTLATYFKYDQDPMFSTSQGQYAYFLKKAKKEDNIQQPFDAPMSSHGYIK